MYGYSTFLTSKLAILCCSRTTVNSQVHYCSKMLSKLEKKPSNEPKKKEEELPKIEPNILPEGVRPDPQHFHRPLNDIPLFMIQPPRSDVELRQLLLVPTPQANKNPQTNQNKPIPVDQEEKEGKDIPKKQQLLMLDSSSEWLPPSPESPHFLSDRRNRFSHHPRHNKDQKIDEDPFSYLPSLDDDRVG